MRRGAVGLAASLGLALALSCASVALGAPKRQALPPEIQIPTRVAGGVTIAWHGDPAHGCAVAGVCDVRGSIVFKPGEAIFSATRLRDGRLVPSDVIIDTLDNPVIVRVRRDPPSGPPQTCVDNQDDYFDILNSTPVGRNRYHVDFSQDALLGAGLSSARCAGPVATDLRDKLPSGTLDMASLPRRPTLLDMSMRMSWSAGPFSGETVSTLAFRVGAKSHSLLDSFTFSSEGSLNSSVHTHHVRVVEVGMSYKIASLTGALTTNFAGAGSPLCFSLDACGVAGTIAYSAPSSTTGLLDIEAARRVRPGEHPTLRSALRELRSGKLGVFSYMEVRPDTLARVTASVARVGDATCTDSTTPALAPFTTFVRSHALQFRLAKPNGEVLPDGLRTRCAGPSQDDTLARGSLAAGQISLRDLGKASLSTNLSRPGTFDAGAYTGSRAGSFTLRFIRARVFERVVLRTVVG